MILPSMVKITKSEKEEILKKYPDMSFTRTMIKDSKRHHYYMVEQAGPMALLRRIRGQEPDRPQWKKGDKNKKKKGVN